MELNPRLSPYRVGDDLVSFGGLNRMKIWPRSLSDHLLTLDESARRKALYSVDAKLVIPAHPDDALFPLKETRPGGWTNSARGQRLAESYHGPITVLDPLSLADISALPRGGAFLYIGEALGGFFAKETCSDDGKIPCARCLILRYLAGRRAAPKLYQALHEHPRVALQIPPGLVDFDRSRRFSTFGVMHPDEPEIDEVLPLPDCAQCLKVSTVRHLSPGVFSPIIKLISLGSNHAAHLPEMLWLSGQDSVGGGGAHEDDPALGQAKAINEALERYAAHFAPATATAQGIPYESERDTRTFSRKQTLLTEPGSVSTGLACRESLSDAIADGLAEVCERDALARFWLDVDRGDVRRQKLGSSSATVGGQPIALTCYQLDSYHHPTVLCVGRTPDGNVATGACCGPLEQAKTKARAECLQNAAYLRTYSVRLSDPPETFDDHAGLYWTMQRDWPDLDSRHYAVGPIRPLPAPVYHADITPPDLKLLGRHAVRVQVPGLLHLPMSHADWSEILKDSTDFKPPRRSHPFA